MADDDSSAPPIRLMTFVSEEELDRVKKTRGERVEDGTAQRDRPLYEILRENKEKKDVEFSERFKHRPPKALDEDETEFLDKLAMSRKEYERQQAIEEAEQLRNFQEAVAARFSVVHEIKEASTVSRPEESIPIKRNQKVRPLGLVFSVKPQAKKVRTETPINDNSSLSNVNVDKKCDTVVPGKIGSLVSYSDESDDDS